MLSLAPDIKLVKLPVSAGGIDTLILEFLTLTKISTDEAPFVFFQQTKSLDNWYEDMLLPRAAEF